MNTSKPIIIVPGEPNSIFFEIFFKAIKTKKFISPILLVGSKKLLMLQMKKLNFKKKIYEINLKELNTKKLNNKNINIININYNQNLPFKNISSKSRSYINKCFREAFKLINNNISKKLITGPISKDKFLNKKFLGITEYLGNFYKKDNLAMLIYNESLSVCPITTHLPLKKVSKMITKKDIIAKVKLINIFYKKNFNKYPKIGVLGLNPHCESIDKFNEDKNIVKGSVKYLKKLNYNITGPLSADTCFMIDNRKKFDVIVGMYHDQVLTPMKTLFEYDAINITLGLPLIRISPDHGPNEKMLGKNLSNPLSLIKAITFLDKVDYS